MVSVTTYTCDRCGKPCSEMYGPIRLEVNGRSNEDVPTIWSAEVCSPECATAWIGKLWATK